MFVAEIPFICYLLTNHFHLLNIGYRFVNSTIFHGFTRLCHQEVAQELDAQDSGDDRENCQERAVSNMIFFINYGELSLSCSIFLKDFSRESI